MRLVVQKAFSPQSDFNSRLSTSWGALANHHHEAASACTEGSFEDAERRQSVRFSSHESSHAHPVQSHSVSRGGE